MPRGGSDDAGEQLERGGLAGAVGAEKGDELALLDRQIDAADGLDLAILAAEQPPHRGQQPFLLLIDAVGLRQPFDFDDGHRCEDYRSDRRGGESGDADARDCVPSRPARSRCPQVARRSRYNRRAFV